ncbi:hypothetical protein GCK32_013810 [Trichostrongylus colubriformis]|uniref:Uncharacterized protein n=1 Tax=Trichostrongylus colubriformis TaxID=6319 RepID=A0AAN8IIN0_TRICO
MIGLPNPITIDGLKSFVENLLNRPRKVTGMIRTNFLLDQQSISLPIDPSLNLKVQWEGYSFSVSTEEARSVQGSQLKLLDESYFSLALPSETPVSLRISCVDVTAHIFFEL